MQAFFEAVASEVRDQTPPGMNFVERLESELEAVIRNPSARRKLDA